MVVTKFALKKAQNSGGISYSQVICSVERDLDSKELESVRNLSDQVKALASNVTLAEIDVEE
jgi:hypothetical protein